MVYAQGKVIDRLAGQLLTSLVSQYIECERIVQYVIGAVITLASVEEPHIAHSLAVF
jgi:hypothetical protein